MSSVIVGVSCVALIYPYYYVRYNLIYLKVSAKICIKLRLEKFIFKFAVGFKSGENWLIAKNFFQTPYFYLMRNKTFLLNYTSLFIIHVAIKTQINQKLIVNVFSGGATYPKGIPRKNSHIEWNPRVASIKRKGSEQRSPETKHSNTWSYYF